MVEAVHGFDNYPNPVAHQTTVRYELTRSSPVTLSILDASGRRVAELVNARQSTGAYSVAWNATDAPAGVYYCTLQAEGRTTTRPLVVNH